MCSLVKVKPHGGFVSLQNDFDPVWMLLSKAGGIHLRTEKKKTDFVIKASMIAPEGHHERRRAIVFLRRVHERGRVKRAAICFECCWGYYYTCRVQRIGMYCKALDKWASTKKAMIS
jgi:hypothetical protein